MFNPTGVYAEAMFFLWFALAAVNLFTAGIRFIMAMQKKGN